MIAKPLAIAAALLPGRKQSAPPKPGGKLGGGKNFFGLGSLLSFAFGGIDFLQRKGEGQTNLQAGAGSSASLATSAVGAQIGSKFPGILKFPATIALGVTGYMLGGKGSDILTGVNKPTESLKPAPTPTPPAPTPAPAQPQTSMMGEKPSTPPVASPKPAPSSTPPAPAPAQPQTSMMGEKPSTPAPSPDMEKKFEQAWQYRNNPMARGRIEDAWNKMAPDQQQQAKTWAQTKGYDWNEMKLKDAVDMSDLKQQPSKTESAEISPAQVSTPPKEPQQVGQLPEPKPSLTMIKTSSAQQQQSNPPLTNGSLTDVPLINSANPDNFYVLYSQLNYNVVI